MNAPENVDWNVEDFFNDFTDNIIVEDSAMIKANKLSTLQSNEVDFLPIDQKKHNKTKKSMNDTINTFLCGPGIFDWSQSPLMKDVKMNQSKFVSMECNFSEVEIIELMEKIKQDQRFLRKKEDL